MFINPQNQLFGYNFGIAETIPLIFKLDVAFTITNDIIDNIQYVIDNYLKFEQFFKKSDDVWRTYEKSII